jgi:hypothetical protein
LEGSFRTMSCDELNFFVKEKTGKQRINNMKGKMLLLIKKKRRRKEKCYE